MNYFRKKRHLWFIETFRIFPNDDVKILDVGGLLNTWDGSHIESKVTLFNLEYPKESSSPHKQIQGDACDMFQLGDKSFDIAYSNSVIEHVGDFNRQIQMANEIKRVAVRYWVQTPYRHFPVEPHFLFPFFQYLPLSVRRKIAHLWPFSYAKKYNLDIDYELDHIWLLDRPRFRALFDTAKILEERFMGLTKSLIAVRK